MSEKKLRIVVTMDGIDYEFTGTRKEVDRRKSLLGSMATSMKVEDLSKVIKIGG